MLIRILSSLVLIAILAGVGFVFGSLWFNAIIALLCVLSVREFLNAAGLSRHRWMSALAVAQAVIIPFARTELIAPVLLPVFFLIIFCYFLLMVKNFGRVSLGSMATVALFGSVVPLFFSSAVYIRDLHGVWIGGYYVLVALGAAWLNDTFAYFVGTFLGKHKIAPVVSPKKTVEGTLGGVVLCTAAVIPLSMLVANIFGNASINILPLVLVTPLFAIIGMLGDLTASAIKREYGVKDFGRIMPGHGGVMDRFDSALFTLPAVYVLTRYFELITIH